MRFENQTVVITGAGRGIGFATANRLAEEGARVAIIDIREDLANSAAVRLRDVGAQATAYPLDISDESQVNDAFDAIASHMGGIHALINAAAIYPFVPFEEMRLEDFRRVIGVNLEGTFLCCRAAYRIMKPKAYGRIVNFSTGSVYAGTPELSAYVASKAGVVGLTRALASVCGPHGVTVNAVSPGIMATEGTMSVANGSELLSWIETFQKIKRQGEAADVAEMIAYLASPGAGFITGQTIPIDGGVHFR